MSMGKRIKLELMSTFPEMIDSKPNCQRFSRTICEVLSTAPEDTFLPTTSSRKTLICYVFVKRDLIQVFKTENCSLSTLMLLGVRGVHPNSTGES